MDFKDIQDKLKNLRDRIQAEGRISASSEAELRNILSDTLETAEDEVRFIQDKLNAQMSVNAGNDNKPNLTQDQINRLSIIEKTGTGSYVVH